MQKDISTNVHIPEPLWKSIKIKAAQEGKTMKDLILEGLSLVLKNQPQGSPPTPEPGQNLLLQFAGKVELEIPLGSEDHDHYIYDK